MYLGINLANSLSTHKTSSKQLRKIFVKLFFLPKIGYWEPVMCGKKEESSNESVRSTGEWSGRAERRSPYTSNEHGPCTAAADLRSPRQRNRKSITAVLGTSYIISSRGTGTVSIN